MKKSLLLLSFAAMASMASADVVVVMTSGEELDAAEINGSVAPGGVIFAENEAAGSIATAYEDTWKSANAYGHYRDVTVDGEAITLGKGAVGNTNPTFVSYQEGVMSAGAVFEIKANADGWITVFGNLNPNKQYVVFENKTGALPYTLGMAGWVNWDKTNKVGTGFYSYAYTLPTQTSGEDEGYIDFNASDASKYFIVATKQKKDEAGLLLWENKVTHEIVSAKKNPTVKDDPDQQYIGVMEEIPGQNKPQFPYLVAGYESAPAESTGFLTFNVLKGNTYYYSALGSKVGCGGFVYTDGETAPVITFAETETLPEVTFNPGQDPIVAGVEAISAAAADGAIYNMMGVRVNDDAKGILIQNGKKFIRK